VRKPDNSIKKDKAFQKKTDRRREKARFMERQSGEEESERKRSTHALPDRQWKRRCVRGEQNMKHT